MNARNVFAGAFVDRYGYRRQDADWLAEALAGNDSVFVPVWGDQCLVSGEPPRAVLLEAGQANRHPALEDAIFLGMYRGRPAFAIPLEPGGTAPYGELGEFHDLRWLGSVLAEDEANLCAQARALVLWHRAQRFCGHCGAPTRPEYGGNTRLCTGRDCGTRLFPRVDPAIIVLVSDGERCLLGRQAEWPEGRYSTIAGFVEPGESLEDAVAREVREETDIRLRAIHYHSSQPWPFPASLMLGFTAEAASDAITLNDEELEDARWFSRKELESGWPRLPYRISIARRLVDDWLYKEAQETAAARGLR